MSRGAAAATAHPAEAGAFASLAGLPEEAADAAPPGGAAAIGGRATRYA